MPPLPVCQRSLTCIMHGMPFQIEDETKAAPRRVFWLRDQKPPLLTPMFSSAADRGDHFRHARVNTGLDGRDDDPITGVTTFEFGTVLRNRLPGVERVAMDPLPEFWPGVPDYLVRAAAFIGREECGKGGCDNRPFSIFLNHPLRFSPWNPPGGCDRRKDENHRDPLSNA